MFGQKTLTQRIDALAGIEKPGKRQKKLKAILNDEDCDRDTLTHVIETLYSMPSPPAEDIEIVLKSTEIYVPNIEDILTRAIKLGNLDILGTTLNAHPNWLDSATSFAIEHNAPTISDTLNVILGHPDFKTANLNHVISKLIHEQPEQSLPHDFVSYISQTDDIFVLDQSMPTWLPLLNEVLKHDQCASDNIAYALTQMVEKDCAEHASFFFRHGKMTDQVMIDFTKQLIEKQKVTTLSTILKNRLTPADLLYQTYDQILQQDEGPSDQILETIEKTLLKNDMGITGFMAGLYTYALHKHKETPDENSLDTVKNNIKQYSKDNENSSSSSFSLTGLFTSFAQTGLSPTEVLKGLEEEAHKNESAACLVAAFTSAMIGKVEDALYYAKVAENTLGSLSEQTKTFLSDALRTQTTIPVEDALTRMNIVLNPQNLDV